MDGLCLQSHECVRIRAGHVATKTLSILIQEMMDELDYVPTNVYLAAVATVVVVMVIMTMVRMKKINGTFIFEGS